MNSQVRLISLVCLCLAACGCSRRTYEGPRRFPLSGKVTVDGSPLDVGTISFVPKSGDGARQRVCGGPIMDGVYSIPEDAGANAGPYRVEIRWNRKTGKKYRDPDSGEEYEERKEGLPAKYHQQSELAVEVSATRTTFDFDLKSQ